MNSTTRRIIGYSGAASVAAALCYGGFFYQVPPDAADALLQAEVKLRFAARLPAKNREGQLVPERESMIAEAIRFIEEAERIAPPSAASLEYRGYVEYLRGDARSAAACYSRARQLASDAATSGPLVLAQARMLAMAGDETAALALLQAEAPRLQGSAVDSGSLDIARLQVRNGQRDAGLARLREIAKSGVGDVVVEAGQLLEQVGCEEDAEAAYRRVAAVVSLANYYVARLKARQGDVDNALGLLESLERDNSQAVRILLKQDAAAWQVCASSERFKKLFPEKEAATPGR
jgi:tetratricopeptide (TPR) repeat protein